MFSINLIFVDAKTIKGLNKKYRHCHRAATVLSFYYPPTGGQTEERAGCLGEIIICLSEAKKQSLTTEELIIHGLKILLSQIPATKLK